MGKPGDLARLQDFFTLGDKENSEYGKMVLLRGHWPFLPPVVFELLNVKNYICQIFIESQVQQDQRIQQVYPHAAIRWENQWITS
jgi:hypothetical protein